MRSSAGKPRSPRPRRAGRLRRGLVWLARALAVVAVALAVGWLVWRHETTGVKIPASATPTRLVVPAGATAESIGRQLHGLGLTLHPFVFRLLARIDGVSGQLKAGEYALVGPLSLEQILGQLVSGDVVRREITVPEGRTLAEIAAIVANAGLDAELFRAAARDVSAVKDLDAAAADLEGYLFPDTYDIPQTPEAPRVLVRRMTQRFRSVLGPHLVGLAARRLTVRQLVTLASIVELETARAEERPRIASVFLNRLEQGMPLQTDPTVIYALKLAGRWNGNIRKEDLQLDSPYNTYRHSGLPPGPIGCPGRAALVAVLEPFSTKDLYFVSRNDGTHQFSETLLEHKRAVDKFQKRRVAS